jgi:hypothetical protein
VIVGLHIHAGASVAMYAKRYHSNSVGSVVGRGAMLLAARSRVLFQIWLLDFMNVSNSSSRFMAVVFTQPVIEMSTRNRPGWG